MYTVQSWFGFYSAKFFGKIPLNSWFIHYFFRTNGSRLETFSDGKGFFEGTGLNYIAQSLTIFQAALVIWHPTRQWEYGCSFVSRIVHQTVRFLQYFITSQLKLSCGRCGFRLETGLRNLIRLPGHLMLLVAIFRKRFSAVLSRSSEFFALYPIDSKIKLLVISKIWKNSVCYIFCYFENRKLFLGTWFKNPENNVSSATN